MKIDRIQINEFARPELTHTGPLQLENVNGQDVLINGENQSGKTLCFNAILYALLDRVIELQRGHGNAVTIGLDNQMTVFRGETGHTVTLNNEEYGPETAEQVQQRELGEYEVLDKQFIHSHLRQLPLERLSPSDRVDLILYSTEGEIGEELANLSDEIENTEQNIEEKRAEVNSLTGEKNEKKSTLSQLESQISNWYDLREKLENGRLAEISSGLKQNPKIESRLDDLTSKSRHLQIQLKELKNSKSRLEELQKDVEEIFVEALEEFVCPVCEGKVGKSEVSDRLSEDVCPFCSQPRDISELKEQLNYKKKGSEEEIRTVEKEIQSVQSERNEIKEEIRALKDEKFDKSGFNDFVINKLSKHNHDLSEIEQRVAEKLPQLQGEYDEYKDRLSAIEDQLSTATQERMHLADKLEELKEKKEEIEENAVANIISDFESNWKNHYQNIATDLERELHFNDDGKVILSAPSGQSREYERRGDLSDAEITLLNISFSLALNDWAVKYDKAMLQTVVLDEPFVRFDDDIRRGAISYLKKVNHQIILTSSSQEVVREFDAQNVLQLKRNRQAEISEFTDD